MKAKEKPAGMQPAGRTRECHGDVQQRNPHILHEPSDTGARSIKARICPFLSGTSTDGPGLSAGRVDATKRTSWPRSA